MSRLSTSYRADQAHTLIDGRNICGEKTIVDRDKATALRDLPLQDCRRAVKHCRTRVIRFRLQVNAAITASTAAKVTFEKHRHFLSAPVPWMNGGACRWCINDVAVCSQ